MEAQEKSDFSMDDNQAYREVMRERVVNSAQFHGDIASSTNGFKRSYHNQEQQRGGDMDDDNP